MMEIIIRLIIAVLLGLLAQWIVAMFLPGTIATLVGLLVGFVVFLRGDNLLS